mmetsp:Transcript_73639/g.215799  ORF Transcript_73639/g.215799 Transcript_73639/m.215799 type:complete len:374 (+) Transcript_73639:208-1329(+)
MVAWYSFICFLVASTSDSAVFCMTWATPAIALIASTPWTVCCSLMSASAFSSFIICTSGAASSARSASASLEPDSARLTSFFVCDLDSARRLARPLATSAMASDASSSSRDTAPSSSTCRCRPSWRCSVEFTFARVSFASFSVCSAASIEAFASARAFSFWAFNSSAFFMIAFAWSARCRAVWRCFSISSACCEEFWPAGGAMLAVWSSCCSVASALDVMLFACSTRDATSPRPFSAAAWAAWAFAKSSVAVWMSARAFPIAWVSFLTWSATLSYWASSLALAAMRSLASPVRFLAFEISASVNATVDSSTPTSLSAVLLTATDAASMSSDLASRVAACFSSSVADSIFCWARSFMAWAASSACCARMCAGSA